METNIPAELTSAALSQEVEGLPLATQPSVVAVEDGGSFDLRIHPVAKRIGDRTFRMLSYDGSIPGTTLRVRQGSQIRVYVTNETDMSTTVHWHGLRLENRYDGVPHETQEPIPPGGRYTHRLTFPDAGLFWYHPHVREDFAQEMGLYANVLVDPADSSYWPPADREIVLTLDDVLVEDGAVAPFDAHHATFAAMGRFGNVMLVGGETRPAYEAAAGEVVRLFLTNAANTRVFKVSVAGSRMKLIGGDGGRYERETWVEDVIVAPSERAIVDVCFGSSGRFALQHVTPERTYELGWFVVGESSAAPAPSAFEDLRVDEDMTSERERITPYLDAPPDKTLALVAEMGFDDPAQPTSPEHGAAHEGHGSHGNHPHSTADGIEWEDGMVELNRTTTPENMRWKLVDRHTGKENADIDWVFDEGDQVKVRLVNEMESDHPMHHPFHVHGERFLVLARNGVTEDNLVWKDTVLLRTGDVVDILLDASNPGLWMAHCHIPEHMESGMMFDFRVRPST